MSCMVSEYFKTEIKKIRARFTERIPAATYSYQSTKIWNDFSVSWGTYLFSGTKREPYPLTIMSFRYESYRMNDLIIKSE